MIVTLCKCCYCHVASCSNTYMGNGRARCCTRWSEGKTHIRAFNISEPSIKHLFSHPSLRSSLCCCIFHRKLGGQIGAFHMWKTFDPSVLYSIKVTKSIYFLQEQEMKTVIIQLQFLFSVLCMLLVQFDFVRWQMGVGSRERERGKKVQYARGGHGKSFQLGKYKSVVHGGDDALYASHLKRASIEFFSLYY